LHSYGLFRYWIKQVRQMSIRLWQTGLTYEKYDHVYYYKDTYAGQELKVWYFASIWTFNILAKQLWLILIWLGQTDFTCEKCEHIYYYKDTYGGQELIVWYFVSIWTSNILAKQLWLILIWLGQTDFHTWKMQPYVLLQRHTFWSGVKNVFFYIHMDPSDTK
jgi:hypothetical protein